MGTQSSKTDVSISDSDGSEWDAHLERSRRKWDRWSDWYSLSESDFESMRNAAIDGLDLQTEDSVLDAGCGPGVNFESIRSEIGDSGRLVEAERNADGLHRSARGRPRY